MTAETEGLIRQMREALAARRAFDTEPGCAINRKLYGEMDYAIAAADEWLSRQRGPLTDSVINAARLAMDESFEAGNEERDIAVPAHLAASLSLCLDEYDRAHGVGQPAGEDKPD